MSSSALGVVVDVGAANARWASARPAATSDAQATPTSTLRGLSFRTFEPPGREHEAQGVGQRTHIHARGAYRYVCTCEHTDRTGHISRCENPLVEAGHLG